MNVEFVSVNPTGPLHVGHARYASYGDALCRILAFVGHDVTREFYVNDYGTQMRASASRSPPATGSGSASTRRCPKRATRATTCSTSPTSSSPTVGDRYRDGARGGRRRTSTALPGDVVGEIKLWGRDAILAQFRVTLERLRVPFDVWTPESTLYAGRRRAPRLRRRGGQVARRPRRRGPPLRRGGRRAGSRRPGTATTRTASSSARPATPPTSSATSPITATRWTAGSRT